MIFAFAGEHSLQIINSSPCHGRKIENASDGGHRSNEEMDYVCSGHDTAANNDRNRRNHILCKNHENGYEN